MTDSTRDKPEPIAISPALVEAQGNLSQKGAGNQFGNNRFLGAASLLVNSLIDGSNPASFGKEFEKIRAAQKQPGDKSSGTEGLYSQRLNASSSFAQKVEMGLREAEYVPPPAPAPVTTQIPNEGQFSGQSGQSRTVIQERTASVATVESSHNSHHVSQISFSRAVTFKPIDYSRPVVKPKPVDSSSVSDKTKNPDLAKWKEEHPEMTPYESKFSWLVNDFRQHPKKYEDWYNAPHKRTRPLPPLDYSSKQSKMAEINTDKMASKGLGHWGPAGYEIAGVGGGSPEKVLKMFLDSPLHLKNIEEHVSKFGVSKKGGRITMRFS